MKAAEKKDLLESVKKKFSEFMNEYGIEKPSKEDQLNLVKSYREWYDMAYLLFSQSVEQNDVDLCQFRSVMSSNDSNHYGLRDNYKKISASYKVLMYRIEDGLKQFHPNPKSIF